MTELPQDSFRIPLALRHVPLGKLARLLPIPKSPGVGDIALARVESIGKNTRLELASGRASSLHEGDRIAVVFGNRYASTQFEGYARAKGDACDLLSMGGVCGVCESKHDKVLDPSRLRLLGSIGDAEGRPLRLPDFALPTLPLRGRPRVVAVCGSAMDVGKTYTATSLILGLRRENRPVAAVKLTGTASGRDAWSMQDAGAHPVLDFVDGGLPSTYLCTLEELLALHHLLCAHATAQGAGWVVMEIADGLLQKETSALLQCQRFTETIDAWVFACGDALAAAGGVDILRAWGLEPVVMSGVISMSPLGMREAQARTGVPCLTAAALQRGELNERLTRSVSGRVTVAP
jgi:hypothetical protein